MICVCVLDSLRAELMKEAEGKVEKSVLEAYKRSLEVKPSSTSAPVSVVTAAIEDALLDSKPYARYQAGNDAKFLVPLTEFLPDELKDFIFRLPK
jgi:hypothetical protein